MKKVVVVAVLAVGLTGCTTLGGVVESPAENSYPATFRSVEDLRDAFVAAGGECPNWEQKNQVSLAAESGTCSTTNVLSVYASTSSRDEVVSTLKSLSDDITLLVGENWIINDDSVRELDPGLGGTLVTK